MALLSQYRVRSLYIPLFYFPFKFYLMNSSNDPLVNHIATVADYINTHRQLPEGPRRAQIFHQFSRYLVSQCWPKMHARINHPTSSFFIEQLLRMDERTMRVAFNEHYKSVKDGRRVDKGLAIEIADLASSSGLVDVMKEHPYAASMHLETQTPLPHLTQTFKEVLAATEDAPAPRAYNVETFLEFHDLVIAVIHGYKKALAETKRRRADAQGSSKGSDTDQEDTILHAHWLWSLARLFWRIAQSSMLRQHLEMLNAHNMLQVQLGTVDGKTTSPVQRSPTTVAPGGDDVDDEEAAGDKDDLEEQAVESKAADDGLVSTFQRWMCLQGIYFASLDALSSFSCQLPADVEITFIAMRDPKEARREIDWKATITSLAASSDTAFPLDAQRAIKAIEDRIQSSLLNPDAKQSKVLKAFRAERQRDNDRVTNPTLCRCPVLFSGTCHCEALLSALAKFLLDAIDPTQKDAARLEKLVKVQSYCPISSEPSISRIVQDLNNRVIAVSKLCCPVCWKLLEILGYLARGRHPLVTPVSLPPWLPRWVVVKLVDEFGEQLRRELVSMISQPPPIKPPMTHSRNISAGTDVSSSTANSGQSGVYAVHQTWIQKP